MTEKHMRSGAIKAGLAALLLAGTAAHACVPAAGQCCQDIACDGGPFVCYETKAATGGFTLAATDAFGTHDVTGTELKRLCAPLAPADLFSTHSVMYAAKAAAVAKPTLTVQTTMGTFTRKPGALRFLQADAEKAIPPDAPAALTLGGLRTCYDFGKAHTNTDVTFEDQFGPHAGTVQEAAFLCLPATSATIPAAADARLCFFMSVSGPNATVNLNAPFGPPSAKVTHTDNWCVPATVL